MLTLSKSYATPPSSSRETVDSVRGTNHKPWGRSFGTDVTACGLRDGSRPMMHRCSSTRLQRFSPQTARQVCSRALSGWGRPDAAHQRRQLPKVPVVDSKLVNVHHCVIESRDDRNTLEVLRLVRRGLRLLDRGGNYAGAKRLFAKGMTKTDCDQMPAPAAGPAAWVAANAMGISLMLGAQHAEADDMLGQAQRHCQQLTEQGLVNDAYTDVAGVLCDRAANLIEIAEEESISKAVAMLKRARFMAERAYRPNHVLIDALSTNLAVALTLTGELEQARDLVKSSVKMGDTLEALKTGVRSEGSSLVRSSSELLGHSKSLALDAAIAVKTGELDHSLTAAKRAWETAGTGSLHAGALECARLFMCLASVHWLAARDLPEAEARREIHTALSRLEAAHAVLSAKQGGVRCVHARARVIVRAGVRTDGRASRWACVGTCMHAHS